jgi:hypothetical protein
MARRAHRHGRGQVQQRPGLHRLVGQPAQRVGQRRAVCCRRGVDIDQDQRSVAEEFTTTAADMPIKAGRPGKTPPPGELVNVALRRVPGHWQARGYERA